MNDSVFQKRLLFVNALIPGVLLCFDALRGQLGVNPAEFATRATGVLTLVFLVLTLLVTPLRKIFGFNWLQKHRRLLGLYAFFYGSAHLFTYIAFDRGWRLETVPGDVMKRTFIWVGMISYAIMIPLAVTSTNAMIRRLGKNWAKLHRITYAVAVGGVIHYYLIVKSDIFYPAVFAALVSALLLYRFAKARFFTGRGS